MDDSIYLLGTGNFGRVVLQAARRLGLNPIGFIDLNPANIGKKIDGLDVFSLEEIKKGHVIVASNRNNIKYLINLLDKTHKVTYELCDFVFNDYVYEEMNLDWSASRVNSEIKNFLIRVEDTKKLNSGVSLNSLDIVLTEKCSLKCKDCSNLMQYYQSPKNAEHSDLMGDIQNILKAVDYISEIRLIGGEPLLYKEIEEVILALRSFNNFGEIVIFTNGTIVPKDSLLDASNDQRIRYQISDYGIELSKNTSRLLKTLQSRSIRFVHDEVQSWQDCATLDKKSRTLEETEFVFSNCCVNDAYTLLHGKIYGCPFSAHAENLNAIPVFRYDSISIRLLSSAEIINKLKELKNVKFLGACHYCNGRDYTVAKVPAAIQTLKPLLYMRLVSESAKVVIS
jgi:organic radical activating enzyme